MPLARVNSQVEPPVVERRVALNRTTTVVVAPSGSTPPSGTTIFGLSGVSVNFLSTSSGSGTLTYAWTFPGAVVSSSTDQNPANIVYNTPGLFNVSLTVTDSNGSTPLTRTGYVTVGCQVPNFAGHRTDATGSGNPATIWTAAGFTGTFTMETHPVAPPYVIGTQTIQGGLVDPHPKGCASDIKVGP